MADETSEEHCVKKQADFKRTLHDVSEKINNITNGNHHRMERERVKKKPGKAVIISGTSTEPPLHDKPIDISDASEYVMEYTDIFGSNSASGGVNSEGEIVEESIEIVGHSKENIHYAKPEGDDDNDDESKEEPPPLESEDDYEYDDSDLGFSPPPIASDGSDIDGYVLSSTHTSPSKSVSSTGNVTDNLEDKETLFTSKVVRRDSRESDLGYREGPPPLDSEEEPEEKGLLENGIGHPDSDEHSQENGEESENESDVQGEINSEEEQDENNDSEFGCDMQRDSDHDIQSNVNRHIQRDDELDIQHDTQGDIELEVQRDVDRGIQRDVEQENEHDLSPESDEEPTNLEEAIVEPQEIDPEVDLNQYLESKLDPKIVGDVQDDISRQDSYSPSVDGDLETPDTKGNSSTGEDSPAHSVSPEPKQFPEDDFNGPETLESNQLVIRQNTPDILSDPETPLLNDELDDQPTPNFVKMSPEVKKNKASLKEKGNSREKSSLLMSESSEEDIMEVSTGGKTNLSDSENESLTKGENIKLIKTESAPNKYLKNINNVNYRKQTSKEGVVKSPRDPTKAIGTKKINPLESKKKAPIKTSKDVTSQRTKVSGQEKGRDYSKLSSVENSTEDLTKKISKTEANVGTDRNIRVKQAPGLAVKDEKPKIRKTKQEVQKHVPGIAVKENTSSRPVASKNKEVFHVKDDKKKSKSPVETGEKLARKTRAVAGLEKTKKDCEITKKEDKRSERQEKTRKDTETKKKEDRGRENLPLMKSETKSKSTRNGEVIKTRQRPRMSTKSYVAVGTEDDEDFDDKMDEIYVEEKAYEIKTLAETKEIPQENIKTKQKPRDRHNSKPSRTIENQEAKGRAKHDRSKHVWLCRDDEIHKLIAQKASLLKEYESGSLAGKNVFSGQKSKRGKIEQSVEIPDVRFSGSKSKSRQTRPMSEIIPDREPYTSRKRENRRSLQNRYSGSSSEDDDDRTNRLAVTKREKGASGTFTVGMSSRNFVTPKHEELSDSDHEETCEYCAAEKAAKKAQERDLAWEGPHHPRNLLLGVVYTAKYLGSSQIMSPQSPNRSVRMQQAQEAVGRIKVPEGEDQPTTDVDLFISTERIKVVNSVNKDIMMDHALRTVSFIADIGDVLVLMARRPPGDNENILETKPSASQILASVAKAETDPKMIKITCHVFQAPEAQIIAKSIGQAFNVAYQEFLRTNGISEDSVEDAEYNCVLEAQKILGEDLSLLSDASKSREVAVNKKPAESLGIMIVESGWGSMIPTAIIAHMAKEGPAAKSGRLNVGDQILAVNNTSLVGLPLLECQTIIKNSRPGTKVVMKVVSCPPTVQVVVNRPDTKYQLGFSVQNGMICSLMRGSIAERGGVRVGHRIIEINGQSVVATSHQHIVDLLASTTGEIRMKTMPASMYRLLVGLDVPQYI